MPSPLTGSILCDICMLLHNSSNTGNITTDRIAVNCVSLLTHSNIEANRRSPAMYAHETSSDKLLLTI